VSRILVFGDAVDDTILISNNKHLIPFRSPNYDLFERDTVIVHKERAGAYALTKLLEELAKVKSDIEVVSGDDCYVICDGTISEWISREVNIQSDGADKRWFLAKELGFLEKKDVAKELFDENDVTNSDFWKKKIEPSKIIAIHNSISTKKNAYCSQVFLKNLASIAEDKLILLRSMIEPTGQGTNDSFLEQLCGETKLVNKTILLLDVNDLRRGHYNICQGLSWEQLLKETIQSLKDNISKNNKFCAIVVCFKHDGCLIFKSGDTNENSTLYFYPDAIEGDFVLKQGQYVFGAVTVMQAALASALASELCDWGTSLEEGVKRGLVAMRHLVENGFIGEHDGKKIRFPYNEVANILNELEKVKSDNKKQNEIKQVKIDNHDVVKNDSWSIIKEVLSKEHNTSKATKETLQEWCKTIVETGEIEQNIPYLRYKKLITYDRREIEHLRNIHQMFRTYIYDTKASKPLSIGVFGPPGAGKGFAINQIIDTIATMKTEKVKIERFEFNVSQMKNPDDLVTAFHEIRNAGISGKCPVVFFDEFDSAIDTQQTGLGWLKYFLAPMQDGKFMQDGHSYFIGRAIFIFAGGTSHSMANFQKKAEGDTQGKALDFLSRLRGYIDIIGLNRECPTGKGHYEEVSKKYRVITGEDCKKCSFTEKNICSCSHFLRRATLLRSMLEKKLDINEENKNEKIQIDENSLNKLITEGDYLHGARSLEAIIQMSAITPKRKITLSCINSDCYEMNTVPKHHRCKWHVTRWGV
jgi:hypothetical protein